MNPGKLIQLRECISEKELSDMLYKIIDDWHSIKRPEVLFNELKKKIIHLIEKKLDKE